MLLEQTLRRIALLVSLDRTVAIVVLAHERFYASLLADLPSRCMAIQPENREPPPAIPLRSAPAHHNGPRSAMVLGQAARAAPIVGLRTAKMKRVSEVLQLPVIIEGSRPLSAES